MFAQYWSHYLLFKRGNLLKKFKGKNKWLFVCTYQNYCLKIQQKFAITNEKVSFYILKCKQENDDITLSYNFSIDGKNDHKMMKS